MNKKQQEKLKEILKTLVNNAVESPRFEATRRSLHRKIDEALSDEPETETEQLEECDAEGIGFCGKCCRIHFAKEPSKTVTQEMINPIFTQEDLLKANERGFQKGRESLKKELWEKLNDLIKLSNEDHHSQDCCLWWKGQIKEIISKL